MDQNAQKHYMLAKSAKLVNLLAIRAVEIQIGYRANTAIDPDRTCLVFHFFPCNFVWRLKLLFLPIAHSCHVLDPKQTEKKRVPTREWNTRGTPVEHWQNERGRDA